MKAIAYIFLSGTCILAQAKDDVIGCYSVLIAGRDESLPHTKQSAHLVRAKDIRLTDEHEKAPWAGTSKFRVIPVHSKETFNYSAAYWVAEGKSLSITWSSNGLSGVQMTLTPTRNGFAGTVENFWDFPPYTEDKRRTVLTRRACD
ncbi:hypothetical protein AB4Z19_22510 [Pseudoduganella sp. RAF19]|uniref:hypothetical protein n=1 Tax=Pseudoduganella sp. RAF19 TaxID=3233052 RepID=UPI003F978ABE